MNILIKLTCLIGLVIAPILGGHSTDVEHAEHASVKVLIDKDGEAHGNHMSKEVKVEMKKGEGDIVTATVTTTSTVDGEKVETVKEFSGTEAEVKSQIDALHKMDGEHSNMKKEIHKEEKNEH